MVDVIRGACKKYFPSFYFQQYQKALKNFLVKQKIEVVLAEYGITACNFSEVCESLQIPLVAHFHGFDAYEYKTIENYKARYLAMAQKAAKIIVVSEDMRNALLQLGIPSEKIIKEPIGVAGLITPWNWPMNQIFLKVIPAIAAGSTCILKPSEVSPLSAYVFSEIMHDAGVPAGVYNMLNGDGVGVGSQMSCHQDIDMISFTGSTRAGALISKAASDTVKRVTLELGGKGANIVFADADDKAVKRGTMHVFNNSGQSCNAPTRMLVERSYYEEAVEIATAVAQNHTVGDPAIEGPHMGAMSSGPHYDKVQNMIDAGIKEGARLVAGGLGRPEGMNKGYFVRPTVFADVTNDMTVGRDEIFGPVLVMMPFDNEAQAYELANDTDYGLTNYVQTQDPDKAKRAACAMRAGMIRINGDGGAGPSPFGGYKQSGNGREGGKWGIEDFCEIKHITGWTL